jgi:hypothetical protein
MARCGKNETIIVLSKTLRIVAQDGRKRNAVASSVSDVVEFGLRHQVDWFALSLCRPRLGIAKPSQQTKISREKQKCCATL